MEIIGGGKEKGTVYIAVLTLAFTGIALVVSTWQLLRQQREAGMAHLQLTASAVLQAVGSSLRRSPMMGGQRLSNDTRSFFRDLEDNGDILFVALVDENGVRLGLDGDNRPALALPEDARKTLRSGARWQGVARYGDKSAYLAARRIQGGPFSSGGEPISPHRNGGRRHRHDGTSGPTPPLFLAVALDMENHFAVYDQFRRTALFQTAYILAAAAVLWVLAVLFLSRRKLAGKAVLLEAFQTKLIDNLPDGLLITDAAGRVTAVNPAAREILTEETARAKGGGNLVGLYLPEIIRDMTPGVDPSGNAGWQSATLGGKELEIRVLPVRFADNSPAAEQTPSRMAIVRDRTRLRTLEKSLAEAETLAAIGSLAAGVAHEIRNPLSALRGFAQYFAKKLAGRQPEEEYALAMVSEADRLNRVITDLLYLARPRDLAPGLTDIAAVCDEMATLLRLELREQHLSLGCACAATAVNADPDALKQALLNLLLNALEALSGDADAPERSVTLAAAPGRENGANGVWITVTDTGPGMTEEQRLQACTPFFTTKEKGTGLGLALVQTIMHGHGGAVRIDSPPPGKPRGCAVGLFFPDAAAADSATSKA